MFENITGKFDDIIRRLKGTAIISEKNVEDALKDVRMSLLEADVNYKVVKAFIDAVKSKAMGEAVLKSVSPGQQFVKIMHDELASFLGDRNSPIDISRHPVLVMMAGLQGSGKTTTAAKLAVHLKNERKLDKILLVGADTYRPAAKDQLEKLSKQAGCAFYTEPHDDAVKIAVNGYKQIEGRVFDAVIFDTAGRLHIDDAMLAELRQMKEKIPFTEIMLVADAMLGQESVNVAKNFNETLGLTGLILTKMDGDARGGAALSMKYTANVPIKFIGTGEKIDRLELFHPDRIASRILGMGDVVTLVEKVQQSVSADEAKKMEEKLRKSSFTLEDFLDQMKMMKNMGPMEEMLKMIPGASKMGLENVKVDENELKRTEAMILSMTRKERLKPEIIDLKRRVRIAKGSGTTPEKVNKLLKQFSQARKMMKSMSRKRHGFNNMPFGGGMKGGFPRGF